MPLLAALFSEINALVIATVIEPSPRRQRGEPAPFIALYRRLGIPTQVVDPSVSRAAVLHGFAGTIFVETPSSAGIAKPVGELAWACAEIPCTATGAAGADCRAIGGEGATTLPLGPELTDGLLAPATLPAPDGLPVGPPLPTFAFGATPPPAVPRATGLMPEELLKFLLLLIPPGV